ncbi:unnamed protein product, partial [Brenthis ino]
MTVFRIIPVVVLLAFACGANSQPDIPEQCLKNSVTEVSCASEDVRDSLLPHPDDCELFYYCVSPDHKPICRQCPDKLHFNPSKNVCDQPERAGCNVNIL